MKKIFWMIFLPLLFAANSASADPLPSYVVTAIQSLHATIWQANGTYYLTVTDPLGNVYCGVSSQSLLSGIPAARTPLEQFLTNIPPLTADQIAQCNGTVKWMVADNPAATDTPPTRPMKDDSLNPITARVTVGTACEDTSSEPVKVINTTQQYRHTTNASGVRGVSVCQQK